MLAASMCTLAADERSDAADRAFAGLRGQQGPGCASAVIHDGRFVYTNTFGLSDLEQQTPITATTSFQVASISKQFTAASIYLLIQDGKLRPEDPVRRFIPELPAYTDHIRITDLLHHTSGLRDIGPLLEVGAAGRAPEPLDVMGSLKLLASQTALNFAPGTDYEYTNSDYLLLGLIVERAAGVPLATFADQRIFRPLGMNNSAFDANRQTLKHRAAGYFARNGQFRRVPVTWLSAGDGGLFTTVEDLQRWDQAFYSGKFGGEDFPEFMEHRGRLASGQRIQYASGLIIGQYRGLRTVSHAGRLPGARSEMIRFPDQQLSVICLCNRGDADSPAIARRIASIFLAGKLHHRPQPADIDYASSGFPELSGVWESGHGGIARAWSGVDYLTVEIPEGRHSMVPLNRRQLFDAENGSGMVLTRISNDQFTLALDGGLPIFYNRLDLRKGDLSALAGDYRSIDIDARYHVSVDDGRVQLISTSGWRLPLEAVGSDRFLLGPWTLRFVREPNGEVSGLQLHHARVWNLVFERDVTATMGH
jgi:CubicO group peptidase (beta-lactamase class C family)